MHSSNDDAIIVIYYLSNYVMYTIHTIRVAPFTAVTTWDNDKVKVQALLRHPKGNPHAQTYIYIYS